MRDSVGGVVVLTIIVIFVAFVSGYMAFNVNYTKAFRMKNKIIDTIEKYEGQCNSSCEAELDRYASEIGYRGADYECPKGYCKDPVVVEYDDEGSIKDIGNRYYYKVTTYIDIQVPIINKLLGNLFKITGDTKQFVKK